MNYKRLFGIIAILAGIGLYFYCQDGERRMQDARGRISSAEGLIPGGLVEDPFTDAVKQEAYRKVDKYKEPIRLCLIGSGILVVGGLLFVIFGTTTKSKKRK